MSKEKNEQSFCGPGAAVSVNKFPDLKPMLSICMTWENSRSQSCHVFHLKFVGKVLWIPFQNDLHRNNGTHTTSKDHHDWYLSCVLSVLVSHHALLVVAPNLHNWVATTPEELAMRSTFHWTRPLGYEFFEIFEGCFLCGAALLTLVLIKSKHSETYKNVWNDDVVWSRLILKQAGNHLHVLNEFLMRFATLHLSSKPMP